jgi:hypothetical protein
MRPPICAICHKDFRTNASEGGLLEFKLTEKDKEELKRFEKQGFVGHPPATEWFCGEHYDKAKKLTHLTLTEAYKILREE